MSIVASASHQAIEMEPVELNDRAHQYTSTLIFLPYRNIPSLSIFGHLLSQHFFLIVQLLTKSGKLPLKQPFKYAKQQHNLFEH